MNVYLIERRGPCGYDEYSEAVVMANTEGAKGLVPFVSVGPIGSRNGLTHFTPSESRVRCGCFDGTLDQFAAKVEATHAENPKHLNDYRKAIAYFRSILEG